MKKLSKIFSFILLCSIIICSNDIFTKDTNKALAAANIRLSDASLILELGHYKTLKVYGTSSKPSWSSSNTWIASVTSSGKVTAKAAGTATITAKVNGKKLSCKLTVVRMNKKKLTLKPGQSYNLSLEGTKSTISWSSSNNKVAKVTSSGKVTAVASGTATVTASVNGKKITSQINVVDINIKNVIMEVGGFAGYTEYLEVKNAPGKVSWSSSNKAVATVASDGTVSAKGPGQATITATVDGVKLTSKIKVLSENVREFTLKMGETKQLKIYGTDSSIKWHSNKKSVALVSEDGRVSTVKPGSAIIMAYVDGLNIQSRVYVVE